MKINEVQVVDQLSDNEFLTSIMADGSMGQIRKDRLLGISLYLNSNYDLNSILDNGIHVL